MKGERIILGIDPGTTIMGFGLIKVENKKMSFIQMNELQLNKYKDHYVKLKLIFERTIELIDNYHPDEIAIEAPFFGKNVQSMLKLGRAQGVAMAAGLSREVPITEYLPKKIKMAITGNGNASKEQVAKMLQSQLKIGKLPKNLDATDGLAAAVCHFYNSGKTEIGKSYTGWDAFIKQNPNKNQITVSNKQLSMTESGKKNVLAEKSYQFALKIVFLCKDLNAQKEYILSRQLLKCGTSIGANVAEANGAISNADFSAKISIAYKESLETKYWLRLLSDSESITQSEFEKLFKLADELSKILYSILKSTRINKNGN